MAKKLTTEEFVRRAKLVHGDKYNYSPTVYVSQHVPVKIICPIHGEIEQIPSDHLNGHGCKRCGALKSNENRKMTIDDFISKSKSIHGSKFDYSLIENFISSKNPVLLKCNVCGHVFECKPCDNLSGRGCPKCKGINNGNRLRGKAKFSSRKILFGIAYIDVSYSVSSTVEYKHWRNIIGRCYDKKILEQKPTYKGCSVCKEWKRFSGFKKWFNENYIEGYEIDKDIISKGNKVYSPSTCCFVPQEINKLLTNRKNDRGNNFIGVVKRRNGYESYISINKKRCYLGHFKTQEKAFNAYKQAKEKHIQEVALEYYSQGKITERVYNALMNYKVEITD